MPKQTADQCCLLTLWRESLCARAPATMSTAKNAGSSSKPLNYDKIFRLFEDKHTRDLTERQVAVINRVCKQSEAGFRMAELEPVCRLLTTVRDRLEAGISSFGYPLCTLVALCGKPFRRSKANEERSSEVAISALFAFVGSIASDDNLSTTLRLAAVASLTSIATCSLAVRRRSVRSSCSNAGSMCLATALSRTLPRT